MPSYHASALQEDLCDLIRYRPPVQTGWLHGNQIERIVLCPGRNCDTSPPHCLDIMSQHIGPIADWDKLCAEYPARFNLLDQFLNRLLERAKGARAIRENRIARNSAQRQDQPVSMVKIYECLFHVSRFAG